MSLVSQIQNALTRIGTEFKTVRTLISGTATGNVSALATTADNLVAAINEVKSTADAAAGGGVTISEVDGRVQLGIDALVASAPGALDTLNELAASIGDDANFAGTVTAQLAAKADASSVYTRTEIGDPTTDFVSGFESALT